MFDIGFFEILLIGIIALLILGPKRLPGFLTKLEEYNSEIKNLKKEIKQSKNNNKFIYIGIAALLLVAIMVIQ